MFHNPIHRSHKITSAHLERMAYVYIRQSTLIQVRENRASAERQYDLAQHAFDLGWPRERILTIDEDQGHSGASSVDRTGFQRLILDVSLGRVGAVLGLEVSRLARSSSDWYRLLELCALAHCLVIDEEGVYDVNDFNDRLILGMKGNLSDYELHVLHSRLLGGRIRKAEQAQLRHRLPAGYLYDAAGHVILDPDEQVQEAVRLAFTLFEQRGSALAVVRYFGQQQLLFPTRHYGGLQDGQLTWHPLRHSRILILLHNPAYAGAYVFGRTMTRQPSPLHATAPAVHTRRVTLADWPINIPNVYPAYISWEQFLRNRQRLDDNRSDRPTDRRGAIREGAALLQGMALCGICGRRLSVRYNGHRGLYLQYECTTRSHDFGEKTCQTIPGAPIDRALSQAFLQAITPAQLAISLETLTRIEKQAEQVERQWQLRLERVRYEAERARRQFHLADPENRLVMRTLERAWEEKLQALEHLQREYETRPRPKLLTLTATDRQKVLDLAQDLPTVWQAGTTTNLERKQLLRLLIKDVTLHKETSTIHIAIRWQTEAVTHRDIEKPRPIAQVRKNKEYLITQVRQLAKAHTDREIVELLNQKEEPSATGEHFTLSIIKWIRSAYQIPTACPACPTEKNVERRGDGRYSVRVAARRLRVDLSTVVRWCKAGKLDGKQAVKGSPWWIKLTPKVIKELGQSVLRKRPCSSPKRPRRIHG